MTNAIANVNKQPRGGQSHIRKPLSRIPMLTFRSSMIVEELARILPQLILNNGETFALILVGYLVESHYVSRTSTFANSIALYYYFVRNAAPIHRFLDIYVLFGLVLGLIGIVSYAWDKLNRYKLFVRKGLPGYYYTLCKPYFSVLVGLLILGLGKDLNAFLWVWFP